MINRPNYPWDQIPDPGFKFLAQFDEDDLCDHNLSLAIDHESCPVMTISDIFLRVEWLPVEFRETKEEEPDGFGSTRIKMRAVNVFHVFTTWCDLSMRTPIYELILGNNAVLVSNGTTTISGFNFEIEEEKFGALDLFKLTIKFECLGVNGQDPFGVTGCCRPIYEEAPYDDECPPCDDSGEGEGEDPYDCNLITFSISRVGNDLVSALGGDPPTPYTIQWQFQANPNAPWQILSSNATSIGLGDYGKYRAILNVPGCPVRIDEYIYSNPCVTVNLQAIQIGNAIHMSVTGECEDPVYSVEWYDGVNFVSRSHDGSDTYFPISGENGIYRIEVLCDNNCFKSTIIDYNYTDPEDCPDVEIEIQRNEGVLIAIPTGNYVGMPTYQWYLDTGNGFNPMGTNQIQPIAVTAYYWVRVTVDGCTYDQYKMVDISDDCELCLLTGVITKEAEILTLEYSNCNSDEPVITWWVNFGAGYINLGTGQTMELQGAGLYKAVIVCGDCEFTAYHMNIVCEPCDEFEVTIEKISNEGLGTYEAIFECDDAIITWRRIDEDGVEILSNNTRFITPSKVALYEVEVNCHGCISVARFVACEVDPPACICEQSFVGLVQANNVVFDIELLGNYSLRDNEGGSFNFPYSIDTQLDNLIDDLNNWYAGGESECCPEWEYNIQGGFIYFTIRCIDTEDTRRPFAMRFRGAGNLYTYFNEETECADCCAVEPCEAGNNAYIVQFGEGDFQVTNIVLEGVTLDSGTPGMNFPYSIDEFGAGAGTLKEDLEAYFVNEGVTKCCDGVELPVVVRMIYTSPFYRIYIECINQSYLSNYKPLTLLTNDGNNDFIEEVDHPSCCEVCENVAYIVGIELSDGRLDDLKIGAVNLISVPHFNFPYDLSVPAEQNNLSNHLQIWMTNNQYGQCCPDEEFYRVPSVFVYEESGQVTIGIECWSNFNPIPDKAVQGSLETPFEVWDVPQDGCCQDM
jgi:hypothetical protein